MLDIPCSNRYIIGDKFPEKYSKMKLHLINPFHKLIIGIVVEEQQEDEHHHNYN